MEEFGSSTRRTVLMTLTLAIFGILFVRLYVLQLLYHQELGKKSEENSIRSIVKEPLRGYMYDRMGRLVVDLGPSYSVTLTPAEFDPASLALLSSLLELDPSVIQERINRGRAHSRFSPTRIKRDIDFRTLSALEEYQYLLPGIGFSVDSKRIYPTPARASHLLGYCKEISDAQLARAGGYYRLGDVIGSTGIEASYENLLRGQKGFEFMAVNARGQVIGRFEEGRNDRLPTEGFDLILGVDFELQAFAESLMTNYRGALVAVDPNDGSIIAMVSKPDFDLSIFSGVTPPEVWNQLNSDTTKPLFNRATMTNYPPGSTFKMVLAAAALEEGVIDEHYTIRCPGSYRFGNRVFKDLGVHGTVNIVQAIQKSCNVFFYQLIHKVGFERWTQYGRKFGFGRRTGIDISEENSGLLPSPEYFDRVYGKGKWTPGFLVSLAIGQGEIGVSPLQMALYVAALANRGTLHQPHVVNFIRNKLTNRIERVEYRSEPVGLSEHTIELIREGMMRVVEAPGGTAALARIPGVVSAGKTGTAQNPHGQDHAWYVGFAPFEHPSIAVAVMLENAGFGGSKAAPLAGLVMEKYLKGTVTRQLYVPRPRQPHADTTRVTQLLRQHE